MPTDPAAFDTAAKAMRGSFSDRPVIQTEALAFKCGWNAAMDEAKRLAGTYGQGKAALRIADKIVRALDKQKVP